MRKNVTLFLYRSYLDKEPQVDILGLGLGPMDLPILFVAHVDALKVKVRFNLTSMLNAIYVAQDIRRFNVKQKMYKLTIVVFWVEKEEEEIS